VLSDIGGSVYLFAGGVMYALVPVPIEQQVNQLLALRRVQEALNLLDRTSDGYATRFFLPALLLFRNEGDDAEMLSVEPAAVSGVCRRRTPSSWCQIVDCS
jgi:hypothetical protein